MTDHLALAKEQAETAFAGFYQADEPVESVTALATIASAYALIDIAEQLRELNGRDAPEGTVVCRVET